MLKNKDILTPVLQTLATVTDINKILKFSFNKLYR